MCFCWGQSPPRKSEDELREEEELQLALALSKSEAEHKEKEVKTAFILFILLIPLNICSLVMFIVWNSAASYFVTIPTHQCILQSSSSISYLFSATVSSPISISWPVKLQLWKKHVFHIFEDFKYSSDDSPMFFIQRDKEGNPN